MRPSWGDYLSITHEWASAPVKYIKVTICVLSVSSHSSEFHSNQLFRCHVFQTLITGNVIMTALAGPPNPVSPNCSHLFLGPWGSMMTWNPTFSVASLGHKCPVGKSVPNNPRSPFLTQHKCWYIQPFRSKRHQVSLSGPSLWW